MAFCLKKKKEKKKKEEVHLKWCQRLCCSVCKCFLELFLERWCFLVDGSAVGCIKLNSVSALGSLSLHKRMVSCCSV